MFSQVDGSCILGGGTDVAYYIPNPLPFGTRDDIYVKVYFHIVTENDGDEEYPLTQLETTKDRMDEVFNPIGIYFDYDCKPNYIPSSILRLKTDFSKPDVQCAWRQEDEHKRQDGLNIYIIYTSTIDAGSQGLAGAIPSYYCVITTSHASSNSSHLMETSVLPHEIGHCFGLFHLHYGCYAHPTLHVPADLQYWVDCDGVEHVYPNQTAEKRASTANNHGENSTGDFVYDTKPSHALIEKCKGLENPCRLGPGPDYYDFHKDICGSAPPHTLIKDPYMMGGTRYEPNIDNFMMSFIKSECKTTFTYGQEVRMRMLLDDHYMLTPMLRTEEQIAEDCGCPDTDVTLESWNITINTDIDYGGDLIVPTGTNVTITSKLTFLPGASVFVERGARLILDGGTLTAFCPFDFWKGVRVQGNREISQPDHDVVTLTSSKAGIVHLKNGALIELANKGIRTADERKKWPAFAQYYGGVIYAENSTFRNNENGVSFMKYELSNKSAFVDCTFEKTFSMPEGHSSHGIVNWACKDVLIEDTEFKDLASGVNGINFKSNIINDCVFDGCRLGIYNKGTHPLSGVIDIYHENDGEVIFKNNETGIRSIGCDLQGADINAYSNDGYYYSGDALGISHSGAGEVYLKNNEFSNLNTGVLFRFMGRDNSTMTIECNEFDGNDLDDRIGIHALGENYFSYFYYNIFDIEDVCRPDVLIDNFFGSNNVVFPLQGRSGAPADNCFSQSGKLEIETLGSNLPFTYFMPLSTQSLPCEEPHDNLSDAGINNYVTNRLNRSDANCRYPLGNTNNPSFTLQNHQNLIDDLNLETANCNTTACHELRADLNKSKFEMLGDYRQTGNDSMAIVLLQMDSTPATLRLLYGQYVEMGEYEDASATLMSIPLLSLEDSAFQTVQLLNLDRLEEGEPYWLAYGDYKELKDVAELPTPSAAYAKALIDLLSFEEFEDDFWVDCSGQSRRAKPEYRVEVISHIAPNPSSSAIYFISKENEYIENLKRVSVYDMYGKQIRTIDKPSQLVNVSTLPNGIYVVVIEHEDGRIEQITFLKF